MWSNKLTNLWFIVIYCNYFIVIFHLFLLYFISFVFIFTDWLFYCNCSLIYFLFLVSFLLVITFDLKVQPASISFAICGLRRIIIVFSLFQTNKMEKKKNGNGKMIHFFLVSFHSSCVIPSCHMTRIFNFISHYVRITSTSLTCAWV